MIDSNQTDVTGILLALQGDEADQRECIDRLFEHVYNELHRIARGLMRRQRAGHTMQSIEIVHEVYLRLVDQSRVDWQNRVHFFRTAAQAMRQILVAYERRRVAAKRGGDGVKVTFDEQLGIGAHRAVDVLALDEVLARLNKMDERMAQVVEFRVFAGMTVTEAAFALSVSERTVHEDWRVAKMWLSYELWGGPAP
jgi:RNA polymerase sigma factor (TIGR02999 family)